MSNGITIDERYGNAVNASDLRLRYERQGAVDVLTAAGMAGVKQPLSLSIWRWIYGQDHNERHAVLAGLVKHMRQQAERRRWGDSSRDKMLQVTVTVADWYNDKTCRHCHGQRYELIDGTPTLSEVPCYVCHGTGERSLDKLLVPYGGDWIKRGKELACHIDSLISTAAGAILRKTGRTIEDADL